MGNMGLKEAIQAQVLNCLLICSMVMTLILTVLRDRKDAVMEEYRGRKRRTSWRHSDR